MCAWCRPGETVIVRDVYRGRVRSAVAMIVVFDVHDRVVLFLPRGAPFALPADRAGRLTKDVLAFDHLAQIRWNAPEQILIARRGAAHAVIARFADTATREIREWYVNLQAPFVRTPRGFDTTDYALDVVISPDLRAWRWKDRDELARLIEAGHFSNDQAEEFYSEGRRVIRSARREEAPFGDGWEHWRPDATWHVDPRLPDGWSNADWAAPRGCSGG